MADAPEPTRDVSGSRAATAAGQPASLNVATLLEELQRRYPGQYGISTLRTIQRRLCLTSPIADSGEREVYFAQENPPSRQGFSDFTHAGELGATLVGVPFAHRLYRFALAQSGWRSSSVVEGGEGFATLSMNTTMTTTSQIEVLTGIERRRRWSVQEKIRLMEESSWPGMSAPDGARKHGITKPALHVEVTYGRGKQ